MYRTYEYYTKTCKCSQTNMNALPITLQSEITYGGIEH
jgi:hypothetical protein